MHMYCGNLYFMQEVVSVFNVYTCTLLKNLFKFLFLFSQQIWTSNIVNNFFQPLCTTSSCRILMYFLIGLSAAPLGLIFSFIFACGVILTSLFLPVMFGPLCFIVYMMLFAYVVWTTVRALQELVRSFVACIKQSFKSSMGWIYKNAQRIPFSRFTTSSLPNRRDAEDDDRSGNNENVEQFRESPSDDACEETEQADVRHFNVRSVSRNKIQNLRV